MGADLDPEKEQEVEEAGEEDEEEHPDYYHIDTDQVQGNTDGEKKRKQIFKAIVLPDRDIQVSKTSYQAPILPSKSPLSLKKWSPFGPPLRFPFLAWHNQHNLLYQIDAIRHPQCKTEIMRLYSKS